MEVIPMALGGLDIGTTGCKCTVMTPDGKILATQYQEYASSRTASAHEIDAEAIWAAAQDVIRGVTAESPEPVAALTVSSFGESCVLLGKDGQVLAPVMLYTDPRGQAQCDTLNGKLGADTVFGIGGQPLHVMFTLPKLMFLRDTQPELYARIHAVLPIHSFIIHRLCGEAVSDTSLASRTMMFDIRALSWSGELLAAGGVDKALLPAVLQPGGAAGRIRPSLAGELGLPAAAMIVVGCQDQIAAAIGAGTLKTGAAVNGSGTVECLTPVFDRIPADMRMMAEYGFAVVPVYRGLFVTYAFTFTGGALLQWFRDHFSAGIRAEAEAAGQSVYAYLDSQVGPSPSGLLALPHFAGAATPYMDSAATGAIVGLTLEHGFRDIYRALLEGVAYESRVNLEHLERVGIPVERLRGTGGGAKSRIWTQIKADVLNRPIETLSSAETGAVGSLILAGLAIGAYKTLEEGMSLVKTRELFTPSKNRGQYDAHYRRYLKLYHAVCEVMRG
jgi:xylulokinase